jgi:outer membrane protein assembly factor BamD (BamD/ComL family)
MRYFFLVLSFIFIFELSAFSQYQYRTDDNADIIRSILEDRVPIQKRSIQPPSPAPSTVTPAQQSAVPTAQSKQTAAATAAPKKAAASTAKKPSQAKSAAKSTQTQGSSIPAPAGSDKTLLESGIHFYEAGNNAAAIDKLQQIRSKYPASPYVDQSSIWLARVLLRDGKTKEALAELAKIGEESGEYPYSLFLAGQIYKTDRKFDEAVESFSKISARFPGHDLADDALIETGKIQLSQNNGQLALNAAAQVVRSYADRDMLDDAYYLIGMVLEKDATMRDLEKAYLVFKKFVYRAEVEKADVFAKSPLLERVRQEIQYLDKNFLKVR